jgi:hypothetical protein
MFDKMRVFLLSLTIIAVLAFSAAGTTIAYADGGTNPEETRAPVSTEEVPPPVDEAATPAPVKKAPQPEKRTKAPPQEFPSEDTPVLDAVPDNTNVTVLNAEGVAQPLATQASAEAIQTSDPIWCPAAQTTPTPGQNGCTISYPSFTQLLNFLSTCATCTGNGTIYVQEGNYTGGETTINFDNFNLSNISGSDLTIQGGWNNPTGTSTLNNVSIIIGSSNPWGGSLTIDNITINNPTNTGLVLTSQNDITVTDVTVTNSTNGAGAELTTTGGVDSNVTIDNSKFTRNKTAGAIINATGGVAISNSWFNSPANARRQLVGLDIHSGADVSLFNVLADQNRRAGATIDAVGPVTIVQSVFSGTKDIVNNQFLGYGLTVVSDNNIVLDGVHADDNFLWGASLTSAAGFNVTIANSTFNANTTESPGFIDDTGLIVRSGGKVTIDTTHADNNRLFGADIVAAGDVTISNSFFNSNNGVTFDGSGNQILDGIGLKVVTDGNINVNNVQALDNTVYGALLDAGQDVTVGNNSQFGIVTLNSPDVPVDPANFGLQIIAGGTVFLDSVTLNNNATFGADITAGGSVFLNAVTALGNGTNGVQVETTGCGELFLIGGTYGGNAQYGLSVVGTKLTQSVAPVFNPPNGVGNIFQDPGTCVFVQPPPPPVVYKPVDTGVVAPQAGTSFGRTLGNSVAGRLNMSLLDYLAGYASSGAATHISLFTGKYAYIYSSSGMQIVMFVPNSLHQFAMGGS